jgi:hypothetical protein
MWSRLQNVGEFMDDHVVRTARQSNPARSMPCHVSRTMATSCRSPSGPIHSVARAPVDRTEERACGSRVRRAPILRSPGFPHTLSA